MTGVNNSISRSQVRKFGAIALPLFGGLFAVKSVLAFEVRPHLFGVVAVFGGLCLLAPGPMMPLYRAWMFIGRTVVKVLSTLMLVLFFYLFLTPYSLLLRLVRGRSLPWGLDRDRESYWLNRPLPGQPKEDFFKRY